MSVNSKMTALADEIRELSGTTTKKGIDAMTADVNAANTEISEQADLIEQLATMVENLPSAGGSEPVLQDKTVTPTTSIQTVTADEGYDGLDTVTVNAIATVAQATPSISVSSNGLITASSTQSTGYVSGATKTATKQLTTESAKTYTPTTSNQTISSGTYLTGVQTIKGDSNLVAGNIKSGVSIFGVNGTYEGSGGSGGGSSTVQTCTVYIDTDEQSAVLGIQYVNNKIEPIYRAYNSSMGMTTLCGSTVVIGYPLNYQYDVYNATFLGETSPYDASGIYADAMEVVNRLLLFKINDTVSGGVATISVYEKY